MALYYRNSRKDAYRGAEALTLADWRGQIGVFFEDVDKIVTTLAVDNGFVRTPDWDFWIGSAPGSYTPTDPTVLNTAEITGTFEGDISPGP